MSAIVSETLRELTPAADGGYTVLSLLKEGTHSRVYLAEKAGKRFVLKAPLTDEGQDLAQLRREWELSIALSHPGLGYVFTWEEASPVGPCLVQEWVDGRSLAEYLGEGHSLSQRKRVFRQLLFVLSYLHRKGVVHNDLSPANILITRSDDAVKIIDLGYADDDVHVSSKAIGGTRGYASPELMAGKITDARSDIWTLGALMRDIFPGKYRRIARKCQMTRPASRYQSVDALEKDWCGYWRPLKLAMAALFICGLGAFVWSYINTEKTLQAVSRSNSAKQAELASALHQLDSLRLEKEAQEIELSKAKDEVDNWYSTAVPEFREKLADANTPEDVYAAWITLASTTSALNNDLPSRTPESVRPAVRDYAIQRYNDIFPSLQEEMNARLQELQ